MRRSNRATWRDDKRQFQFVLEVPKGLSSPRTLRSILAETPQCSLNHRIQLAKQLARSVTFVYTSGFVHKISAQRPFWFLQTVRTASAHRSSVALRGSGHLGQQQRGLETLNGKRIFIDIRRGKAFGLNSCITCSMIYIVSGCAYWNLHCGILLCGTTEILSFRAQTSTLWLQCRTRTGVGVHLPSRKN